jgi:hypothetical protein
MAQKYLTKSKFVSWTKDARNFAKLRIFHDRMLSI